ncbi:hypothetical protein ACKVMT_10250 [Halobacteriales archaeon Cl-PHB]
MATRSQSLSGVLNDYKNLRTIPAILGIVFAVASAYQFGGISEVHVTWAQYTLTSQHAMMASMATFLVAFASSKTKSFEYYERWEQVAIAAGPLLIVAHHYLAEVNSFVANNSPTAGIMLFMISIASWGAAVR